MNEALVVGFNPETRDFCVRYEQNQIVVAELRLPAPDGVLRPSSALLLQAFLNRILPKEQL